jgi:CBS domain containing-hemolysin-like protein
MFQVLGDPGRLRNQRAGLYRIFSMDVNFFLDRNLVFPYGNNRNSALNPITHTFLNNNCPSYEPLDPAPGISGKTPLAQMDKDPLPDSREPSSSFFKRLSHFIGLARTPDTTEDLEQEIQELLEEGEEQGLISRREGQMINSIFEFKDTLAREVMTPRSEMICAPATATAAELIGLITDKGFSRIPIYGESPDQIIGIIHAKDLLRHCATAGQPPTAGDMVAPVYIVSENHRIIDLLREFQTKKMHMAVITDEFGSIRGLITMEDILEEIVGEISDEYDKTQGRLKVVDQNTLLVDAKIDIEDIETFFGIELPEEVPYESVGGLIIHQLGRVPEPGETAELNSLTFQVISASRRRINIVKVQKRH